MKNILRNKHLYYMVLIDGLLVAAAYLLAYYLRFDMAIPGNEWLNIRQTFLYALGIKLGSFFAFGLYRGMWRYTGLVDLRRVVVAVTFASMALILLIAYQYRFYGFPRSVYVIDWVLTLLFIGGVRIIVRIVLNRGFSHGGVFSRGNDKGKKLLIIGAGAGGEKVLREIMDNPVLKFQPVGFLDDDRSKWSKSIHGVPVLGAVDLIRDLQIDFDEILIAIPSGKGDQIRRIVDLCEETGKRFRTMPSIGELIDGKVSLQAIREVRMEDLLGREEVRLEKDLLRQSYEDKRVLITGAGGSIGRELVRQICRYRPARLALLDFSEFNLFAVEMMCKEDFPAIPISTYLTDIRDKGAVLRAFGEFKPAVVFHAAAYKHVPLQELHPRETICNNVLGTRNLVEAANEEAVERFVLVSTDKAVRPTNVMGAAKRVAEIYLQGMNGNSATRYMAVRFGNVLGSSGSVVPIFQQQIATGQAVTVTDPEVTRYFMSIPEAAQLILQAGAMGQGGGDLYPGHGQAHPHCRYGAGPDSPARPGAGQGYPHPVYGPAPRGKAL